MSLFLCVLVNVCADSCEMDEDCEDGLICRDGRCEWDGAYTSLMMRGSKESGMVHMFGIMRRNVRYCVCMR